MRRDQGRGPSRIWRLPRYDVFPRCLKCFPWHGYGLLNLFCITLLAKERGWREGKEEKKEGRKHETPDRGLAHEDHGPAATLIRRMLYPLEIVEDGRLSRPDRDLKRTNWRGG